eukprot:9043663-Alexandrium_andersonii.AAC.1
MVCRPRRNDAILDDCKQLCRGPNGINAVRAGEVLAGHDGIERAPCEGLAPLAKANVEVEVARNKRGRARLG